MDWIQWLFFSGWVQSVVMFIIFVIIVVAIWMYGFNRE